MTGTMADLLLLILFIAVTLLLCTGFDRIITLPFFNPSKLEAKVLLIAIEDLVLPLGSLPIKLLHPWADLSSIGAGLNTAKSPPPADEDNQNAGPESGLPHPEQNSAKNGPLDAVANATGEQTNQQQQGEEDGSTAAMEKLLMETQAFERSIRELVDPNDTHGLDLPNMIELVARIIEQKQDAEESLRSEKVRFQRAEEDLRHGWEDMKEVFECVIEGQNAMLIRTQQMHDEILKENETLLSEKTALEKYQHNMDQYNDDLKTLKADKEWAEQEATTIKAEVESRINAVKEKHRQERLATEQHTGRERNTLLCQMRMVQDTLRKVRCQATLDEQKHEAAMKECGRVNKYLDTTVQNLRLTLAASQELSASTEQRLRTRLDDQGREKDHEISILKDQHQNLTHEIQIVRRCKFSAEQESHRLSDRLRLQTATFNADKKRIEDRANRDLEHLRRTIATDQVIINDLVEDVVRLKSGEEVQDLVSQLEDSKAQLQQSAKDTQNAKKQLQYRKRKIKKLRETIKARDHKIKQDADISSTKMENLKKQLEQTLRVTDSRLEEEARKLKEQEQGSSRKLEMEKRKAVENANRKGVEDAKKKQEEHEKDKKDALQNAVNKAAEHAEKKEEEHKKEMRDAVQKAVKKAIEEARQAHQQKLEEERKSSREAQVKAIKIENDLRTEMGVLKSQVEQGAESKSRNSASAQPDLNAKELIVQTREADEANNLLLEIGRNGIAQDSVECVVVQELSNAKLALYNIKCVLRERGRDVVRDELVFMIASGKVDEQSIQQLNATTWSELAKEAKWAQARLRKVEDILAATINIQKDLILEAINAPYREIRKARGSKRHTQQALGTLPSTLPTGVQAAISTSGLQTPSNTMRDSGSGQGVPGSTDDGRSSLTPQRQGDLRNGGLGFNLGDIDKSHPVWDGVNFNMRNEGSGEATESSSAQHTPSAGLRLGRHPPFRPFTTADIFTDTPPVVTNIMQSPQSMDRSMQAKRDHRQSFADIMASVKAPASSEIAATAVTPEPGSNNDNNNTTSNTTPPDLPAKTPQKLSAGGQLLLPGLLPNSATDDTASVPPSAGGGVNASLGCTQAQQSELQGLVIHTQQGGSVDSTQQEFPSDQPKGWTVDMTTSAEALLENGYTNVDQIITLLKDEYENISAIEGVEEYIQNLKDQNEDWIPDMPVGWTDSMTGIVKDMLHYGDDVDLIVDFMKVESALQTNDIKCLEQWVKKLQSDHEAESKG